MWPLITFEPLNVRKKHYWHNCFWMSSWGSPLLDPKKLQNEQFYIIDWIRKKLLVDVANLATYCHYDDDVLLEVLGTLRKCYVSSLLGLTTFALTRARVSRALAENDSLHSDHRARARGAGKGNRGVTLSAQPGHTGSWEGTLGTQRDTPGQMLC